MFEYGCGGSTVFWSRVAKHVDSVEHVAEFYREVLPTLPGNCRLTLEVDPEAYIHAVARRSDPYDIIVVDGHSRVRCSAIAPQYLKAGGFIVLDNSDWFYEASTASSGLPEGRSTACRRHRESAQAVLSQGDRPELLIRVEHPPAFFARPHRCDRLNGMKQELIRAAWRMTPFKRRLKQVY